MNINHSTEKYEMTQEPEILKYVHEEVLPSDIDQALSVPDTNTPPSHSKMMKNDNLDQKEAPLDNDAMENYLAQFYSKEEIHQVNANNKEA